MSIVPVHNIGQFGIIRDLSAHELPPEAWSDGQNVRFQDGKVIKFKGHSDVFDPPSVPPYWALGVPGPSAYFWLYPGLAKAFNYSSAVHTDITRVSGDYTGAADDRWNGGILGGIPVFTNGVDDPQQWSPVAAATKLVDLANWPASTTAKVIKPFKNFLVALDITLSGTRSGHKVKWSHPADPGTVPTSWDETDATKDAGETELTDIQAGFCMDCLPLGDLNLIYKEASVWGMQHIGGKFIFRFFNILETQGILAVNAVGAVPSARGDLPHHFVMGGDDVYLLNGRTAASVIDRRQRKWLNGKISSTRFNRSFVARNLQNREMWACFAEEGADWPNLALVWNWKENTITVRELTGLSFIASGAVQDVTPGPIEDWDSDAEAWDDDLTSWDELIDNPKQQKLLGVDAVNTKFYFMDNTNQFSGTSMTSFIERTELAIIGVDRQGNPKVDFSRRKLITRIRPKITGGPVRVKIGSQEVIDGVITWTPAQIFTPGIDSWMTFVVNALLFAVHFESVTDGTWELEGYDLEIQPLGMF